MCQHGEPQGYPTHASAESRPVRSGLIRSVHERRLGEFVGGQFGDYNLASVLFEGRIHDDKHVSIQSWTPKAGTKPTFDEAKRQTYTKAKKGIKFGPSWTNHWLKLKLNVPKEWVKKEWVQLEFDPGCEAVIYNEDGLPLQGITGGYEDKRRVDFPLKPEYRNGVLFYIEVTANGMFGLPADGTGDPDPNRYFELESCDIVVKRVEAWKLLWDFELLQGYVKILGRDTELQNRALWVANQIQNTFRKADLDSIPRCRKLAQEILGKNWEDKVDSIYDQDVVEGREDVRIWSLGHSHIDSAWLWPYSATQQKVARSWSTQMDLMDRYPEHRFTASTAQQYQWLETLYPDLFKKLKGYVKDGRFQPIGGSWVECDANMPSGEAFARQFLYGQRYFLSRFGKRCDIFWLPDTFGYNAQIPQLARQSGCDYFFTQKLSWNNINRFPHNTVMWVGLDGTQIIVHMTPVNNYDSKCSVEEIVRGIKNNQDIWVQPHALMLYGFGDGGGGPSEVMVERLRRARAANNNGFKDMPRVHCARSAKDFFEYVREATENGRRLSTWSGEIYLEFHRGVYTSHGSIKQWNRRFEAFMQKLEWLATLASIKASGYRYPKEEIDAIWEPLLLNQFHDCLPGSSIRKVYDDLEEMYADMAVKGQKLWRQALNALGVGGEVVGASKSAYAAINTLDLPRRELVEVELGSSMPRAEAIVLSHQSMQLCRAGQSALLLLEDPTGRGQATVVDNQSVSLQDSQTVKAEQLDHNSFLLQSPAIAVKVSKGRITSIYDRLADRELIEGGRTAGLAISEDYPPQFDNWETELYSLDTGRNHIHQRDDARPLLRFDTQIDWWEKHRFLRFNIPTRLRSDSASYETQFGITKRPTTRNTSWEAAKFEVCGHRFADLSEEDYGLSLLTESKYGYSVEGGLMRLSLLKAGTYPDAHEDEGLHRFAFALYPHVGGVGRGKVVQVARAFNARYDMDYGRQYQVDISTLERSSTATVSADLQMPISIVDTTRAGVVIGTIKRAEEDFEYYGQKPKDPESFSIIVRLYESLGAHAKPTIKIGLPVKSTAITNLLEDVDEDKSRDLGLGTYSDEEDTTYVQLELKPFEIKTFKITL
ncbi:hypothetical protein NDA18_000777 [Ustilago nuda]|nr:hypothetical protein NDA18_000777 [Ustilago nuda]